MVSRRAWVLAVAAVVATALGALPEARAAEGDDRPVFVLKAFTSRGYQIESRTELKGIGKGLQVLVLALDMPEADGKAKSLARLHRLFVLDGERVELDSFIEDGVEDGIEPSINTPTFFGLTWTVTKGKAPQLVLAGVTPQQIPGEPVRVGHRTLVLSWTSDGGFDAVADVVSARPATLAPGELKVPLSR